MAADKPISRRCHPARGHYAPVPDKPFGRGAVVLSSKAFPAVWQCRPNTPPGAAGLSLEKLPRSNFSGTSSLKFRGTKGSIGHTFMVCIHTENQNQGDFYPFILLEISVLNESPLGHLRYLLTDVPPQPNSPPDNVIGPGQTTKVLKSRKRAFTPSPASPNK